MKVVPMAYIRHKDRLPLIEPSLAKPHPKEVTLGLKKKLAKPPENPYGDEGFVEEIITYFPAYTQEKRVERIIESDEVAYRREKYPTMAERINMEKEWNKTLMKEARREATAAERQKRWEKKILKEAGIYDEIKKAQRTVKLAEEKEKEKEENVFKPKVDQDDDASETQSVKDSEAASQADADDIGDDDNSDNDKKEGEEGGAEEDMRELDELDEEEYRMKILELKEDKFVKQRQPYKYHRYEYTNYQRSKMALKLSMGFRKGQHEDYCEVTPWIIMGTAKYARQYHDLKKLGVTHIMNVSNEVDNFHTQNFVYKRVPLPDNEQSNMEPYFPGILDFFDRVKNKKAKIFVHCTAGASRAPTAVCAYLVVRNEITLCDAFNYLRSRRMSVRPNRAFLFNLAELEIAQGQGSSVLHHEEWRFYEFNLLKGSPESKWREPQGVYKTVKYLYTKEIDENDLFS